MKVRFPHVRIEVPFAADNGEDGELHFLSWADAGKTETSAPVSIKKCSPECLSVIENVFVAVVDVPAVATSICWLCRFP